MLSLLLAAVLAQAAPPAPAPPPRVAVMLVLREGLSQLEGAQLVERMAEALTTAKVPVAPPSETDRALGHDTALGCRNKPACVAGLARQIGAPAAIGLEAADMFGELVVHLMLVDARGTLILERTSVLPPDRLQELDLAFGEFADATRPAISKLPAFAKPPDVPHVTSLTPGPGGPASEALRPGPPVAAWALGGTGLASGVAAAIFGAFAYGAYQAHDTDKDVDAVNGVTYSPLTRPQYDAMNRNATIAAVTGGVSAALLAGATYFFFAPRSPPAPH